MIHQFERGEVVEDLTGRMGVVVDTSAMDVEIEVLGTFPEHVQIEQGDPEWWTTGYGGLGADE